MPRRKIAIPNQKAYKSATAIDTSRSHGRATLWLQRLERARNMLEIDARLRTAANAMKYVNGSYAARSGGSEVYLNEALPALEDLVVASLPGSPPPQVEARQMGQERLAEMASALLDSVLGSDLCRARQAMIRAEWDEIKYGIGIVKTVWNVEERPSHVRLAGTTDYLSPHIEAALIENANPIAAIIAEDDDDVVHLRVHDGVPGMERHMAAHYERLGRYEMRYPIAQRVKVGRFLYDPDADEWEERDWQAELCDEFVTDLQGIPGIKNLNPENCPATDEFDNGYSAADSRPRNAEFDFEKTRVRVWKIHDRAHGGYLIVPATNTDSRTKPLIEADWPYGSVEIYNKIVHRPSDDTIHGLSTLELIAPILDELARTNASIRRHNRRAANAKMLGPRGGLDRQAEMEMSDESKAFASAPTSVMGMLKEFKPPSTPPELLQHRDMLLSELRRMLGADIMTQGGDTPHRISASEAVLRGQYHGNRIERRMYEISAVLSWMGLNLLMLYRDWANEAANVRVMGPMGPEMLILEPSAIPEDLVVRLDVQMVGHERQNAAAELQAKMTYVDKVMQYAPDMANRIELLRMLGKELNIRNTDKHFVAPGTMPMAQPGTGEAAGTPSLPGGMPPNFQGPQGDPQFAQGPQLRLAQ